jgi:glycosyltransferase involved in cell wall biosynthesis
MTAGERWHLVTGEYPPQRGGVSDYTRAVARGLAAGGGDVHVWCPAADVAPPADAGVAVHAVAGSWSKADLRRLDALLDAEPGPRHLVVQWVPHAYGHRSVNVRFCAWVQSRGRRGDRVDLMVHEAFHAFGEGSWRQDAAAAVHRVMVTLLLNVTTRAWVAIPAWADRLRRYAWGREVTFCWLPVPSNVPVDRNASAVSSRRAGLAGFGTVVGHFGTYNRDSRRDLTAILPLVLDADPTVGVLLVGRDSDVFRAEFLAAHGQFNARVQATGALENMQVSHALQACDVLVQPYPDGASTRRSTLMAALEHGVPVVTTVGRLSDRTWATTDAVVAVRPDDVAGFASAVGQLLRDADRRRCLADRARRLYAERFDITHTVAALLADRCDSA